MAKSAGFLKKLKKLGGLIGKGISWVNNNIVKPLNPVIDTALDFIPGGGVIKKVKDFASNAADRLLPSAPENKQVQEAAKLGADVLLDTQRGPKDRKYIPYGNYEEEEDEYIPQPPPRRTYKNPFGSPLNGPPIGGIWKGSDLRKY